MVRNNSPWQRVTSIKWSLLFEVKVAFDVGVDCLGTEMLKVLGQIGCTLASQIDVGDDL